MSQRSDRLQLLQLEGGLRSGPFIDSDEPMRVTSMDYSTASIFSMWLSELIFPTFC